MKKLSKTQMNVLEDIIRKIKDMKEFKNIEEYLKYCFEQDIKRRFYKDYTYKMWANEKWLGADEPTRAELKTRHYHEICQGEMIIHGVNKRTLAKLQEFGYIDNIEEWCSNDEKIQVNLEACGL